MPLSNVRGSSGLRASAANLCASPFSRLKYAFQECCLQSAICEDRVKGEGAYWVDASGTVCSGPAVMAVWRNVPVESFRSE